MRPHFSVVDATIDNISFLIMELARFKGGGATLDELDKAYEIYKARASELTSIRILRDFPPAKPPLRGNQQLLS